MLLAAHSRRASRSCRVACADRLANAPASPLYLALHFLHVALEERNAVSVEVQVGDLHLA